MQWTVVTKLDADDLAAALAIRRAVFTDEQGISAALDVDGYDGDAEHVLIRAGTTPVATGRLRIDEAGNGVLARIAVVKSHRGRGLGQRVVKALEMIAATRGVTQVCLWPHRHLALFYGRMGYVASGAEDTVAGHDLIQMGKPLG